jgi:LTXXQ motif family protein
MSEAPRSRSIKLGTSRPVLTVGIALAATLLLSVPLMTTVVDARGGGGGHGGGFGGHGGGFGGHVGGFGGRVGGFSGGHIGGFGGRVGGLGAGGRSVGFVGRGAGLGARSFSGARVGGVGVGGRGVGSFSGARVGGLGVGGRGVGFAGRGIGVSGARVAGFRGVGVGRGAFANRAIANAAFRSRFGFARFHGRFFGSPWPWWWGGFAFGWIGPVFWPYAYYDVFDYVFWPYAYDDFWPYAYDDIYYGMWGPYAYGAPRLPAPGANGPVRGGSSGARRVAKSGSSEQRPAEICGDSGGELTDWPIDRISEVVQPTDTQRPALDELRTASGRAIDILKAGCPKDLPSTPTGRLSAMEGRLQVMLQAVQTVRPPLDRFYQSLTDEQKARFNAVAPGGDSAAGHDQRDLTKLCDARAAGADLPIDRIAQAVQPTPTQRSALDELKAASTKAAEGLKANCPSYQALTPTGRIEAMEKRLQATLDAVQTVQPALTKFYDGLTDEQKARFNSLRSTSRPTG